jgi:hypothetical protein
VATLIPIQTAADPIQLATVVTQTGADPIELATVVIQLVTAVTQTAGAPIRLAVVPMQAEAVGADRPSWMQSSYPITSREQSTLIFHSLRARRDSGSCTGIDRDSTGTATPPAA